MTKTRSNAEYEEFNRAMDTILKPDPDNVNAQMETGRGLKGTDEA